ncbi:transposase [Methylocaldum sp.]|uniref:transposase n=1 Tax=Methylocaldum sp. TaxID=1969727 RepID=UPI002D604CD4|nr:transposase [Methylocaldum sp.]HYE35621.1 transposase [Methylocaldum sp.]
MKTLISALDDLLWEARKTFPQHRTFLRARQLALGFVITWGRHTISRALCAIHRQFEDWSASYRLFSRSPWDPAGLFRPVLSKCLELRGKTELICIAMDDTALQKSSKRSPGTSYTRDPMSPKFHPNLVLGQRYIQATFLLRPQGLGGPARSVPVRFTPAPPPAKPGKKASEAEKQDYRRAQKTENLSCKGAAVMQDLRTELDSLGAETSTVLFVVDGSYCNRNALRNPPERSQIIGRARGDITLYALPTAEQLVGRGRRRKYGDELPKPKAMQDDKQIPWKEAEIFGAGRIHNLRFKEICPVLWKSGTRARPLRLIIIAPLGYRPRKKSKKLYRDPAYLLTTDLTTPAEILIQAYFDRWEIEVNHREEKSMFGVGQAQVWSEQAAPRVPQFQVAIYAMLLVASLMSYGPTRTENYHKLPKWRPQEQRRPSIEDIMTLVREELVNRGISNSVVGGQHASRPIKNAPGKFTSGL